MRKLLLGLCFAMPPQFDVKRLEFTVEKLGGSLQVSLDFPRLSTHAGCEARDLKFGTIWETQIDITDPVRVSVHDRNKVLVQEFSVYGPLELKVVGPQATLRFFSAFTNKAISDFRLFSAELASEAPRVPPPSIEFDEDKARRTVPAKITLWP